MSKYLSILVLMGASIFGGCQSNARLTFIDKSTGDLYTGETGATYRASNGNVSALIENDTYSGIWSYQASGGSYSLVSANSVSTGSGQASDGYNTVNASGTSYNYGTMSTSTRSAQGDGLINIKGFSGAFIRCVFTFNTRSSSGLGQCLRNDGREYDLTIQR